MNNKALASLVIAMVFGAVVVWTFATIPVNLSGVGVQPTIKVMDKDGNVKTLPDQLLDISYPSASKIQVGVTLNFKLAGISSAKIAWWLNYRIELTSAKSGKSDYYDDWEGDWTNDNTWAGYWQDTFDITVTDGQTLDLEPCKKAWYDTNWHRWAYNLPDGWIPLDPDTTHSFGDWIKWKWGETPAGNYQGKLSLHVKVNYFDNMDEERCAIGPPNLRPTLVDPAAKSGELIDILTFTVNYEAGKVDVTVTPNVQGYSWIPLDFSNILSPGAVNTQMVGFVTSLGLPSWSLHAIFVALTVAFVGAAVYFHKEG